jgi:hypothetical protein
MMSYSQKVNFTKTGQYGCGPEGEDDVYTVKQFRNLCSNKLFVDYDGYGHPVKESLADESITIKPSRLDAIPADATHVVWYNK